MAVPSTIQNSFVAGEISPSLFGRTDLGKYHSGASTMRNFFANYRGGASSRAGTAYVGTCKQPGTGAPPRDIPFQFNINQGYALEFGDQYMRVKSNGAYVIETAKAITAATKANPVVITSAAHGYSVGDWVYIIGMTGMTNFNGLTWIISAVSTNSFSLNDLFGNPVNSTTFNTYISGGTVARIYTVVAPYSAVDLPYLKYTQSADTMSLTCVNQETDTEYPIYDLQRLGNTNWVFTQPNFGSTIAAPKNATATAQSSTTLSTWYSYVVTAVDVNGQESVASNTAPVENNDIAINAGSNTITWTPVTGAISYNIYKATPSYSVAVAIGAAYGYIGLSLGGTTFTDTNIIADFTVVPPLHKDPFARGAIQGVTITGQGSGYAQATVGYTITTATGTGFVGTPVIDGSGKLVAFIVSSGGKNYLSADTITITGAHTLLATATLNVGHQTGTYPSVVAYYQQRRGYANTLQNPDTYYFSQPGLYLDMDSAIPVTDSDAIVGNPWAQQVNGIQFMIPMTTGLVILTGNGAWLLNGGTSAALTPSDQTAQPQAYNGSNSRLQPIVINYDMLYVQTKGSIVRDLSFNFFVNVFTGTDTTVLSNHLFNYHQLVQWTYAEEPYKLVWIVRDDGIMLSFTYLKEQDVYAYARHDTNGFYVGVCSITEPPVDAVYVIVKRYVRGQWMYYSERMDNRNWQNAEDAFCIDAGLVYPMSFPTATLTPASAEGSNNISSVLVIQGGAGYTAPTIRAVNSTGGIGATFTATLSGGVITAITPVTQGAGYTPGIASIVITDTTGSGAVAQPVITNNVLFTASSAVFNSGNIGSILRIGNNNAAVNNSGTNGVSTDGGGQATITSFISSTQVMANITQPITSTIPNDPTNMPVPAISGQWSISVPTTVVSGLNHLEGLTVVIVGDGSVIPDQIVINGTITLPVAYSSIKVGLPFICQLQTLYLDPVGGPTIQGKRKNLSSVSVRLEASRGLSVGANQPDQSTQPNNAVVPWTDMKEIKERNALITAGSAIPLFTGDHYVNIPSAWDVYGQVAIQQTYPMPANILALIVQYVVGDT